MQKTIDEIRCYDTFIYDKFDIVYEENVLMISFFYEIVGLKKFVHKLEIPFKSKKINKEFVKKLVFNIGMLELVSYYKATFASKIIVKFGMLNQEQINFFKKIYFYGLGEFCYVNGLTPSIDDFVTITSTGPIFDVTDGNYEGRGSLIAIGGGKDSCVTLSIVPKEGNECFIINPKNVMLDCAYTAGYSDQEICNVKRIIDSGLIELNNEGFLNGHTPFSAMVAFVSYLTAYLNNKKAIILSNESSANEANVAGTNINHQYSKSYEFEVDFTEYAKNYLGTNIKYFSLLRPLSEYQIGMLFAKYPKFHSIFKSCNVGSKEIPWKWCGNCAKCLFVFSLLSPFLYKEELVRIFDDDLFEKEELLTTFKELLGYLNVKPFDCVGTFEEINYAITKTIKRLDNNKLPFLLKYYKEHYYNEKILDLNLEKQYNESNNLSSDLEVLIKGAINYDK